MNPKYMTWHGEKYLCQGCKKTLVVLSVDLDEMLEIQMPVFCICFDCKRIFQRNKGEIKVIEAGESCE